MAEGAADGGMKRKMSWKEDKDYEIKFWKDWLHADHFERLEMVKKLPIIKEIIDLGKLDSKLRKQIFSSNINSFFEDLESAVYTKIRLEQKKIKRKTV